MIEVLFLVIMSLVGYILIFAYESKKHQQYKEALREERREINEVQDEIHALQLELKKSKE